MHPALSTRVVARASAQRIVAKLTNYRHYYHVASTRRFSTTEVEEATADTNCSAQTENQAPLRSKPISILESLPVTFADISRANVAIRNGVMRTQCKKSYFLSELLGANIWLKTEFQQFTGSFKG